ncbi:MAG: hypothetical protein JXQ73_00615 [Phycisphaerae bacterium]|nr:hypothetical protein [Phycisphaerae bacterium]
MSDTPDFSVEKQINRRLDEYLQDYWFQGHSAEQFWRWQVERRQRLRRAMRLDLPPVYANPRAEVLETESRRGVQVELIALETECDFWLPVYMLRPTGPDNGRTLIALHGEGRGAVDVVGLATDEHARRHVQQYRYDYAERWARAGFVVAAPELRGYGRLMLQDDRQYLDGSPAEALWRNSVARLAAVYLRIGRTYAGCCVADLIRLIDYLETRPDVDRDRIGIGGMGEGARALSWLVSVEDRVSAAAATALRRYDAATLLGPRVGAPAMIDSRALVDHASIFSCLVRRPLCIQAGRRGSVIPVEEIETIGQRLSDLYRLCKAEDRFALDIHGGADVFNHDVVIEFFEKWL